MMKYFIQLIKNKHWYDINRDFRALEKLWTELERAKRALSSYHQVRVEIRALYDDVDFSESLTRARFEELNIDLFVKIMDSVKKVMHDAGLEISKIAKIVLVGGSTRIPKVQQLLVDYFEVVDEEVKKEFFAFGIDDAIAYGAVLQGSILRDGL